MLLDPSKPQLTSILINFFFQFAQFALLTQVRTAAAPDQ